MVLEEIKDWSKTSFSKLEALPSKAKPVSKWKDSVEAIHDIATGIGKIVRNIIIEGGGPFEFGPHEFTEAELAILIKDTRDRTTEGLNRLRNDLHKTIPARKYESNLLLATWSLRQFGRSIHKNYVDQEPLYYMAQIISSFDLVALQEIDRDLKRLEALLEILGPDWEMLVTDIAPGAIGNRERFAFLYYKPRVEFRNFSSLVVLPPQRTHGRETDKKASIMRVTPFGHELRYAPVAQY